MSNSDFTPDSPDTQDPDHPGPTPYLTVDYSLAAKMYVEGVLAAWGGLHDRELAEYFLAAMTQHQEYDDLMSMVRAAAEALTTVMEDRAQDIQT